MNNFLSLSFGYDIKTGINLPTLIFVGLTILCFGYFIWQLFTKIRAAQMSIKELCDIEKENKPVENNKLLQLRKQYEEKFNIYNKSEEGSYNYFNESSVLKEFGTNLKQLNSVPSLLVGLGILGTFVGLTSGISNFDTESSATIQKSISTLLSGMGTAFVTSIWGMGLSLLYSLYYNRRLNKLHNSISSYCEILDQKFLMLPYEQNKRIFEYFFSTKDDDGNENLPGNVLREIHRESKEQTKMLSSFSTDLADVITAGFEKILSEQMKTALAPLMVSINEEIKKLSENLKEPASEVINNVVQKLESIMKGIATEFSDAITGETKNEIEKLIQILTTTSESLNGLPEKIEQISNNVSENIDNMQIVSQKIANEAIENGQSSIKMINDQIKEMRVAQDSMIEKQYENLEKLQIISNKASLDVIENTKTTSDLIATQLNNFLEHFNLEIQNAQNSNEFILSKQAETVTITEGLIKNLNVSIESMSRVVNDSENLISSLGSTNGELNSILNNLNRLAERLDANHDKASNMQSEFISSYNILMSNSQKNQQELVLLMNKIESSFGEINNLINRTNESTDSLVNKYSTIENGLKTIFEQIQTGIIEYRNVLKKETNDVLSTFHQKMVETLESINGVAEKNSELLEEYVEFIEKNTVKIDK